MDRAKGYHCNGSNITFASSIIVYVVTSIFRNFCGGSVYEMSYRKHPTMPGHYQIIVSMGRKAKQQVFVIECSEDEAIVYDKQINAQIKGHKLTMYPTLTAALPDYLVYYKTIASPDIVKDFISVMRRCLLPHFGAYPAHLIVQTYVYAYTSKRLEQGVCHRTIEKELNYLSAMCRWFHVNGMAEKMPVIPKPPKAKTKPQKVQQPLTLEELANLITTVSEEKQALIMLMSDAGLRMSEALNLEWKDVDLSGCRVTIKGKGGKVVVYPILTKRLQGVLTSLYDKKQSQWVAMNDRTNLPYGSIKTLLRLASKRAGITKHVTHHTLRHSFSVLLMEAGISTEARKQLMRHSSLQATEFYTHTSPVYMRNQAKEFSDMINTSESMKQ